MLEELLRSRGFSVFSSRGSYGDLIQGKRHPSLKVVKNGRRMVLRGNYSGEVLSANIELIRAHLKQGETVLLSPPAISYSENPEGEEINVDGDISAAHVAYGLSSTFVILTDTAGLLKYPSDESSLIPYVPRDRLPDVRNSAQGRFNQKLDAVEIALENCVGNVIISDGRIVNPITQALSGRGTHFS